MCIVCLRYWHEILNWAIAFTEEQRAEIMNDLKNRRKEDKKNEPY